MKRVKDTSVVLVLASILVVLIFWNCTSHPIQNKGIVQFGHFNDHTFGCSLTERSEGCLLRDEYKPWEVNVNASTNNIVASGYYTESYNKNDEINTNSSMVHLDLNVRETKKMNDELDTNNLPTEVKYNFIQKGLITKNTYDEGIHIEKPDVDMRDRAIQEWKNNDLQKSEVSADLRDYQQLYSEGIRSDDNFKNMSIEDHRKANIEEWKERVSQTTSDILNNTI